MPDIQSSDLVVFCVVFFGLWLLSYLHIFRLIIGFFILRFLFRIAFPAISGLIMYYFYSKQ